MKTVAFILLAASMFCSSVTVGQNKANIIETINKECKSINSDSSMEQVILDYEEYLGHMTDGGSELTGYYKDGKLRKIASWIGISLGNEIFEYYFKDDKLIFVYEKFHSFVYDDIHSRRLDTTETTFIGRYYFSNNTLIDHETTGHNRLENDAINIEGVLLKEAMERKQLLERKRLKSH